MSNEADYFCACLRLDALDCARARYSRRGFACDDTEDDWEVRQCAEPCECPCHDESRDELGGDDDA